MSSPVIERRAARVLLVDRAGRTLLLHGGDPARPGLHWWFTPGGGLTGDETPAQGAARELHEETGLRVDPAALGEPVWRDVTEFSYNHRQYRQDQDFYLLRVDRCRVDRAGMDEDEQRTITGHRWWSPAEIDASDELIYPPELPDLLRRLTALETGSSVPAPATGRGSGLSVRSGGPGAGGRSGLSVPSGQLGPAGRSGLSVPSGGPDAGGRSGWEGR